MRTVGVDLAASPKNTGVCVVDWDAGDVALLRRPICDEQIVDAVLGCDMAGFDVPLGWPDEFVEALVAHRDGRAWPPVETPPPADRVALSYRLTDLALMQSGSRPLSVSADRIGVAAMRSARLQHLLRAQGASIDRSGTTGVVAEVYPAAALRTWGLTSTGYKRAANRDALRALVAAVVARCGGLERSVTRCLTDCADHDLDALVCAVLALAARRDGTTAPAEDDMDVARREGWIHVPTRSLEEILRQPTDE